jgi:single stranded DNA-binding protein
MAINNKIELNGYLGKDAKSVKTKNDKSFIILSVATTDSYPEVDEKTGEVKWKDKGTMWHDVLVFRPQAAHFAKDLKKGDAVEINGGIAYRMFKDEEGNTRKQASIIAHFVEKIEYAKQGNLLPKEVDEAMDEIAA